MASTIQAIRFHEYGDSSKLRLETIPKPVPQAGEVLIKVRFAGVNPVDWKFRAGYLKDYIPIQLPYVPGIDVVGVVEDVGPGVTNVQKGQTVFGLSKGGYAEYALAGATEVVLKPSSVSDEAAATLPVGVLTAWKALDDAGVHAGQTVLVVGAAGGVGVFAVQLALWKGAKVIGVASTENLAYVQSLGVSKVVDYKKGPIADQIDPVDVVVDAVGGESLEKAFALVKKGGTLVTVAGHVTDEKAKAFGIRALNSGRGPAEHLKKVAELVAEKKIVPRIGDIFPLSQAAKAHDLSQKGHGNGRILLRVEDAAKA